WPHLWHDHIHYAFEVYYPGQAATLRLVPFGSLLTASANCSRLWLVWDRTWWMNVDEDEIAESRATIAKFKERFVAVETYEEPAVEMDLLENRSGTGKP